MATYVTGPLADIPSGGYEQYGVICRMDAYGFNWNGVTTAYREIFRTAK